MALNIDARFKGKLTFAWKFSPEHLKVSELGLSLDSFIRSKKCISLKFAGELFVMTMIKGAKFEVQLTCRFKIDMKTLMNFDQTTQES